jgi:putative pre-16S rRNA nuclease
VTTALVTARGVRIAIDVGSVRVGVACSDPDGVLASPVATLRRDAKRGSDLDEIVRIADEREAVEVVVGLPRSLSGAEGPAAATARDFAAALASRVQPIPVRLYDERLTTVDATRRLRAAEVAGRRQRAVIDQAAAVVLLEAVLDAARRGLDAGEAVEPK